MKSLYDNNDKANWMLCELLLLLQRSNFNYISEIMEHKRSHFPAWDSVYGNHEHEPKNVDRHITTDIHACPQAVLNTITRTIISLRALSLSVTHYAQRFHHDALKCILFLSMHFNFILFWLSSGKKMFPQLTSDLVKVKWQEHTMKVERHILSGTFYQNLFKAPRIHEDTECIKTGSVCSSWTKPHSSHFPNCASPRLYNTASH